MREKGHKNHYDEGESDDDSDKSDSEDSDSDSEEMNEETKRKIQKQLASIERRKKEKAASENFMNEMSVGSDATAGSAKSADSVTFGQQVRRRNREDANKDDGSVLHRNHRGEAELTFVPKKAQRKPKKKAAHSDSDDDSDNEEKKDSGRSKPRFQGRRSASKNTFRGM